MQRRDHFGLAVGEGIAKGPKEALGAEPAAGLKFQQLGEGVVGAAGEEGFQHRLDAASALNAGFHKIGQVMQQALIVRVGIECQREGEGAANLVFALELQAVEIGDRGFLQCLPIIRRQGLGEHLANQIAQVDAGDIGFALLQPASGVVQKRDLLAGLGPWLNVSP